MGKELNADSCRQILTSGEFDRLIGTIETQVFECKSTPYMLDLVHQRQELAKDVVSALCASVVGTVFCSESVDTPMAGFGCPPRFGLCGSVESG
jgi:hypothetical protein